MDVRYKHELEEKYGLSTSRVYVSVNNIITPFYVEKESNASRKTIIVNTQTKKEIPLEDVIKHRPILNLERKEIFKIDYATDYSLLNIITDDYAYLQRVVKDNANIVSVISTITKNSSNPNIFLIDRSELEKSYLSHVCMEIESFLRYGMARKRNQGAYQNFTQYAPLLPLEDVYLNFMAEYGIVLPKDLSPLINSSLQYKQESDKFLWVTYKELADFFKYKTLKIDPSLIFYLFSAAVNNLTLYILTSENEYLPKVLTKEFYKRLVEDQPDVSEMYTISDLLAITIENINKQCERRGYTKLTRDIIRQLGCEI